MAHARQQIRDAVVSALTTASMTTYSSRVYAVSTLPSVNVTTPSESIEIQTTAGIQNRELIIKADLMIDASTDVDDAADAQSVTIEKTLLTDSALLALVGYIELNDVESELSGDGDKPILVMSHTFTAQYRVSETDPEVIIP